MSKLQNQVLEFHRKNGVVINERPTVPDADTCLLRHSLIREETQELLEAFDKKDIVKIADAIGDLLMVVYGTAVSCGLNMDKICDEIHRSNMTKSGKKREDGKVVKSDGYSPPDLKGIVCES